MTRIFLVVTAAAFLSSLGLAAAAGSRLADERTWLGEITDNMCAKQHESFEEFKPVLPAPECTMACIRGGSKFVLRLEDGGVLKIANQDLKALAENAGLKVKLTGELKDGAAVVSKVEKAGE